MQFESTKNKLMEAGKRRGREGRKGGGGEGRAGVGVGVSGSGARSAPRGAAVCGGASRSPVRELYTCCQRPLRAPVSHDFSFSLTRR